MMEKRLFLAVFLSFIVLVGYQFIMGPNKVAKKDIINTQVVENKEFIKNSDLNSIVSEQIATPIDVIDEKEYVISNDKINVTISNLSGSIKLVYIQGYEYELPVDTILTIANTQNLPFVLEYQKNDEIALSAEQNGIKIIKKFKIIDNYYLNLDVSYINQSQEPKAINPEFETIKLDFTNYHEDALSRDASLFEYSISSEGKIKRKGNATKFGENHNKNEVKPVDWVGFRDRYFAAVVHPNFLTTGYSTISGEKSKLDIVVNTDQTIVNVGDSASYGFDIFLGPQDLEIIKSYDKGFEKIISFNGFFLINWIAEMIHALLRYIHMVVPNWGLCIIIVSFIIYGVGYPLTMKSMKSMRKMQTLQPKIQELKEKYKDDAQKLNQEIMVLYTSSGVNPIGGCLPMLLQMPIFIGLYQVLWRSIYFRGADFLWIKDLSKPDQLFQFPISIPLLGDYFNILPILMMGIMFVQQKLNAANMIATTPEQEQQQKMMAIFMPIVFGFIFYNFASGLSLYFTVFYLLSTFTQWKMSKEKVS